MSVSRRDLIKGLAMTTLSAIGNTPAVAQSSGNIRRFCATDCKAVPDSVSECGLCASAGTSVSRGVCRFIAYAKANPGKISVASPGLELPRIWQASCSR